MTTDDNKNLLNKLKNDSIRIAKRIKQLRLQDPFSDTDRDKDNAASDTDASEESGHDRISAMIEELELQLSDTNNAIEKIKKGVYGTCDTCSSKINPKRLTAFPTVSTCLKCSL